VENNQYGEQEGEQEGKQEEWVHKYGGQWIVSINKQSEGDSFE
jgi:hypothetical protein